MTKRIDILLKLGNTVPESFRGSFMNLERRCFHPNLQADWAGVKDLLESSTVCYIAYDGDTLIGASYVLDFNPDDFEVYPEYWKEVGKRFGMDRTGYFFSLAVLSKYQGQGIANRLIDTLLNTCWFKGYTKILSHAKAGACSHLHEKFGGIKYETCKNWYNTKNSHTLYLFKR